MNYVIKDKRSDVYITRTRHGGYRIGTAGEAKTWKTESGANAALDLIASVTSAGASTLHVIPEPEVVAIAKERVAQVEALRRGESLVFRGTVGTTEVKLDTNPVRSDSYRFETILFHLTGYRIISRTSLPSAAVHSHAGAVGSIKDGQWPEGIGDGKVNEPAGRYRG